MILRLIMMMNSFARVFLNFTPVWDQAPQFPPDGHGLLP